MCKAVEEYGNKKAVESAALTKIDMVKNLMETMKLSAQQIMDGMKLSSEEQKLILSKLK